MRENVVSDIDAARSPAHFRIWTLAAALTCLEVPRAHRHHSEIRTLLRLLDRLWSAPGWS